MPPARSQAHAAAVLQAVAPHLHALEVHSEYDIEWLPRLPALTSLSLSVF